jgi:hypothetical protein
MKNKDKNKANPNDFTMNSFDFDELCQQTSEFINRQGELQAELFKAWNKAGKSAGNYQEGMSNYLKLFIEPQQIAVESFLRTQKEYTGQMPSPEEFKNFAELLRFNLELAGRALNSSLASMTEFHLRKLCEAWVAAAKDLLANDLSGQESLKFISNQASLLDKVVHDYPRAIQEIKSEYGFHFEQEGFVKVAETEHFYLYQVLPWDKKVKVRTNGKPVILIPPYVLGENILCFLAGERKSYAHAYADQGVPTYIRVVKDIATTPAVQDMDGEDDVRDTRYFCEKVKAIHGQPATLNGYCQGGFFATLAVLSGELEGLVDTLITCVTPLDGTRSQALAAFMADIPERFTALDYAVSQLPNGKPVVNGRIMSWVYKLKSIENEAPLVSFFRDLTMFDKLQESDKEVSKTACAINYWLLYDQTDMPVGVTKLSFASYTTPVTKDGTLPITLFNRKLNFKYIEEKGINFLICIAAADDLVDREAALAACDYIKPEVTIFPKGHAAIATSWSHPESKCALHTVFGDNYRGPVRYHLDIEAASTAGPEKRLPAVKAQALTTKETKTASSTTTKTKSATPKRKRTTAKIVTKSTTKTAAKTTTNKATTSKTARKSPAKTLSGKQSSAPKKATATAPKPQKSTNTDGAVEKA